VCGVCVLCVCVVCVFVVCVCVVCVCVLGVCVCVCVVGVCVLGVCVLGEERRGTGSGWRLWSWHRRLGLSGAQCSVLSGKRTASRGVRAAPRPGQMRGEASQHRRLEVLGGARRHSSTAWKCWGARGVAAAGLRAQPGNVGGRAALQQLDSEHSLEMLGGARHCSSLTPSGPGAPCTRAHEQASSAYGGQHTLHAQ